LAARLRAIFGGFLLLLPLEEAGAQDRQCLFFVFELATTVLTTNNRARGNVQYLHGRVGRVHALTTWTARARDFDAQISGFNSTSTSSASGNTATVAVEV